MILNNIALAYMIFLMFDDNAKISFAPILGYHLQIPLNDVFGWILPDVNIILPSFDIIGSFWRCLLRPIFMPQEQESSWTSTKNNEPPKIIKSTKAFLQPLAALKSNSKLVRKITKLNDAKVEFNPTPPETTITKRLHGYTSTEGEILASNLMHTLIYIMIIYILYF